MPYTTATGRIIPDDFFAPVETSTEGPAHITTKEPEIELPGNDHKDFDLSLRDNPWPREAELHPGAFIKIVTTVITQTEEPKKRVGPIGTEQPDCEIYEFTRTIRTIEKRFVEQFGKWKLYSWIEKSSHSYTDSIKFCGGAAQPRRLHSRTSGQDFPPSPPPAEPGKPYFWRPPEIRDKMGLDHIGAHTWPEQDGTYFYDVRFVLKLRLPVRLDGCLIRATYDNAWRVTKILRSTGKPERNTDAKPNPSYHTFEGGQEKSYRIPNCPPVAEVNPKIPNPRNVSRFVRDDEQAKVWVRTGNEWTSAKTKVAAQPDTIHLVGDNLVDAGQTVAEVRIMTLPEVVLDHVAPEFAEYLTASNPTHVLVRATTAVEMLGTQEIVLIAETAETEGFVHD